MKIPYINIHFKSLYLSRYDSISRAWNVHAFQMRFLVLFCFFKLWRWISIFKQDSMGYLYPVQPTHPLPLYICAQHVHAFLWYVLYLVLQSKYFCSTRAISYRVEWNQRSKPNWSLQCQKKPKCLNCSMVLILLCKLETMFPGLWKSSFRRILLVSVFTVSTKV